MKNKFNNYIIDTMINVPAGIETIRTFKDNKKWISSNSRMSIPSSGENQKQTIENIKIDTFQIAKYPVTNELYDSIMNVIDSNTDDKFFPKVNISWFEAIEFCNALSKYFKLIEYYRVDNFSVAINEDSDGFRLPTDAEWQYACKGGSQSYQYGEINNIAWHRDNSDAKIHNVGEKEANKWELYDMLGNVWEWCWDLYNEETYSSYRIFRGGSYAEEKRICGSTTRRKSHPTFSIDYLGFRLARTIHLNLKIGDNSREKI